MGLFHPVEEEISSLVDGELTGRRRRHVALHILQCPECSCLCGELLATRRSLEVPELSAAAPAQLWSRVHAALDTVDSVGLALRQPVPFSSRLRLPALAALGMLLICGALWVHHDALAPLENIDFLVQAHLQAGTASAYDGSRVGLRPEGAAAAREGPVVASRLLPFHGGLAQQMVWQVGPLTVSEFTLPPRALRAEDLQHVGGWGGPFYVGIRSGKSLVAWRAYDHWGALVSAIPPDQLLGFARFRAASSGEPG